MTPNMFFLLVSILFSIGLVGIISRRNLFVIYMSIELMLSSVNLLLATLSKLLGDANGSVMALLLIAVIAAEAALFLAMITHLYRQSRTLDSDHYKKLSKVK
ncbi:NADH-quinone oxidoreductase subunit NuoK [Sulfurimonas aquatica]|uniref:NADH-quinone oxidoreductase subunit K n=1 Tax=Sulfurimonas aquatica TaxID=2672570 RepID=A0A975AZJ8_9BACT|nr:NADH-quinone oxidoreductase subunit NuoK [Sulfurimonas aquatica]QSZ41395.1 NADH-quinone oxidoreductase subunit NuoK [Sulfurimonas aquatica]